LALPKAGALKYENRKPAAVVEERACDFCSH
jgi:hypothetical protein